jgi:hypothetical protein
MSTLGGFVQVGNTVGIAKESQAATTGPSDINGNDEVIQGYNSANFNTIQAMRTRLTALNAYYTTAVLNQMTYNDMVYAVRVLGP